MFVARVLEKGQIVIPKKARDKVKLSPGDKVEVKVTEEGIVILPFKKSYTESFKGHVKARDKVKLSPGDKVEVKVTEEGIVILPFKKSYTESFKGHVKGKLSLKELEKLYAEKS